MTNIEAAALRSAARALATKEWARVGQSTCGWRPGAEALALAFSEADADIIERNAIATISELSELDDALVNEIVFLYLNLDDDSDSRRVHCTVLDNAKNIAYRGDGLAYEDTWHVGTFLDAMAYRDTLAKVAAEEDDYLDQLAANA